MSFIDDIADDADIFEGTETVTISRGNISQTVPGTTACKLSKAQMQLVGGQIGFEAQTRSFSLPVAGLGGFVPRDGDRITDASSTAWKILSFDLVCWGTRYVAACNKAAPT
jgi:hypothetical protein